MEKIKIIGGSREYLEFEDIVEFEYEGKLYERVMYSSDVRDCENVLYIREKDGDEVSDELNDLLFDVVEDEIDKNMKESDVKVYGTIKYK